MRYFNSIALLLLVCCSAFAQKKDSVNIRMFIPTSIRVGVDVVSIAKTEFGKSFEGFETAVDIDLYRYYPTVEFGNSASSYVSLNGSTYANEGNYWRAGIDVNFLKKDPEKNMFFLGARYGRSKYSEDATLINTDPVWGDYTETLTNTDLTASWMELTTGVKVKVWKLFWLGYTARFKFWKKLDDSQELLTSEVPGYGWTDRGTTWGFSYYALVKIPLPKKK